MSDTIYYSSDIINSFSSKDLVSLTTPSKDNLFKKIKTTTKNYSSKLYDFIQKPETKIASLVSYWAVETVVSVAALYAFFSLHMYGSAFAMIILLAYLTYATFGVIGEVVK